MACDRLVHRIVEDLGNEMMESAVVRAADIHAGTPADRLQSFENFDVLGGIAVDGFANRDIEEVGHGWNIWRTFIGASSIRYGLVYHPLDIGRILDAPRSLLARPSRLHCRRCDLTWLNASQGDR